MRELIRKILNESIVKDQVKQLIDDEGLAGAIEYIGGADNLIKILYDGDIIQYYEEFLPQNETYWESEHIYQHLDQVLSSIPSIGNNDILLSYSTTLSRK